MKKKEKRYDNILDSELVKELEDEMKAVIETSKMVREYMGNREIPLKDRRDELGTFGKVLEANKNIVSAAVTILNVERMK